MCSRVFFSLVWLLSAQSWREDERFKHLSFLVAEPCWLDTTLQKDCLLQIARSNFVKLRIVTVYP